MSSGTLPRPATSVLPENTVHPTGEPRAWRPALRLARRIVRRNIGRSLLVAALVGLPVAAATMVDGLYRTMESRERETYLWIGDADASVLVTPIARLGSATAPYVPEPWPYFESEAERDPASVDVASLLPAGAALTPAPVDYWDHRVEHGDGTTRARVNAVSFDDPLTSHAVRLVSGTWPAARDEVLITKGLADRLELLDGEAIVPGATVTFTGGPTVRPTGIGLDPREVREPALFTAMSSPLREHLDSDGSGSTDRLGGDGTGGYLVDLPEGADAGTLIAELAGQGIALVPRDVYLNPEQYWNVSDSLARVLSSPEVLAAAGLVILVSGLALLEVVLLAGAAFAVGARRQVRGLGLVGANGGTPGDIRRIVLAQGLVLGLVGAAIGLAVGVALTVAGRPIWQRFDYRLIEEWRWGGPELAIAASVGVFSGIAAAIIPAVGASRLNPIDALAQRFRATPLTAQLPKVGVVLLAAGAVGALLASRTADAALGDYAVELEQAVGTGTFVPQPDVTGYVAIQLAGAVAAIAGLIMSTPFVITAVARRAGRIPVAARYAARDAARHRHRTTPAVAAIMIAVAGASGVAVAFAAQERVNELRHTPLVPPDTLALQSWGGEGGLNDSVITEVVAALPGSHAVPVPTASRSLSPEADGASYNEPIYLTPRCHAVAAPEDEQCFNASGSELAIASPEALEAILGSAPANDIAAALDAGSVVLFDEHLVDSDGTVHIELWDPETGDMLEPVTLPGYVIDTDRPYYQLLPRAFISSRAAVQAGWEAVATTALISHDGSLTDEDIDRAIGIGETQEAGLVHDRGPDTIGAGFLALTAGSALVTLVGVGIVISLAAAEGRADLATMAAVGAPPRRRREIAAWQAIFVAGLGTTLGMGLGLYYGYLTYPAIGSPDFIVPWPTLARIGIGVPVLAALVAAALTRSRLPMIRRIE